MRTRLSSIISLITVLALAAALTAAVSGAALARSTFQSSPLLPDENVTPVVSQPVLPDATPEAPIGIPTQDALVLTPDAPLPLDPPITEALPGAAGDGAAPAGFLPAPTLTSPDAQLPLPQAAQPPLVGPAAPPVENPSDAAAPAPAAPSAAQLIDNGIIALSYVWMCCGALLLGGLALLVVWLARRSKSR